MVLCPAATYSGNRSKDEKVRTIIIPKGVANPNETNIIEIPASLRNSQTLIARPSKSPNSPRLARALPKFDDEFSRLDSGDEDDMDVVVRKDVPGRDPRRRLFDTSGLGTPPYYDAPTLLQNISDETPTTVLEFPLEDSTLRYSPEDDMDFLDETFSPGLSSTKLEDQSDSRPGDVSLEGTVELPSYSQDNSPSYGSNRQECGCDDTNYMTGAIREFPSPDFPMLQRTQPPQPPRPLEPNRNLSFLMSHRDSDNYVGTWGHHPSIRFEEERANDTYPYFHPRWASSPQRSYTLNMEDSSDLYDESSDFYGDSSTSRYVTCYTSPDDMSSTPRRTDIHTTRYSTDPSDPYSEEIDTTIETSSGEMDDSLLAKVLAGEIGRVISPMTPSPVKPPPPRRVETPTYPLAQRTALPTPPRSSPRANRTYPTMGQRNQPSVNESVNYVPCPNNATFVIPRDQTRTINSSGKGSSNYSSSSASRRSASQNDSTQSSVYGTPRGSPDSLCGCD